MDKQSSGIHVLHVVLVAALFASFLTCSMCKWIGGMCQVSCDDKSCMDQANHDAGMFRLLDILDRGGTISFARSCSAEASSTYILCRACATFRKHRSIYESNISAYHWLRCVNSRTYRYHSSTSYNISSRLPEIQCREHEFPRKDASQRHITQDLFLGHVHTTYGTTIEYCLRSHLPVVGGTLESGSIRLKG